MFTPVFRIFVLPHDTLPPRDFEFQFVGGESSPISLGRLKQCLSGWYSFGASSTVLKWIAHGVPIRWRSFPPAPRIMRNSVSAVKYRKFVDEAVSQLLSAGAIQQVRQCPKAVSPFGVVTKTNSDKLKLIVNMRYVNKALVIPKFKMETLSSLEDVSKPFDFMVLFDLKSGFWHVALAEDAKPWVAFQWPDDKGNLRYFQFRRLPFGLAIAPWAFTKIMRQLVSRWRGMNIRVLPYLDDVLFMAATSSEASALAEFIMTEFRTLGMDVNYEKSVVNPTQRIE